MILAAWDGNKLRGNGVVIAEIKPHMEKTFKVMYADKPDNGPSGWGYKDEASAKAACETRFGVELN